jgi:hypothetical protein
MARKWLRAFRALRLIEFGRSRKLADKKCILALTLFLLDDLRSTHLLVSAGDHSTGVWVGGSDNGHHGKWAWFPTGNHNKNYSLRRAMPYFKIIQGHGYLKVLLNQSVNAFSLHSGQLIRRFNWGPSQPSGGDQHCMYIVGGYLGYQWADFHCDFRMTFLCEHGVNPGHAWRRKRWREHVRRAGGGGGVSDDRGSGSEQEEGRGEGAGGVAPALAAESSSVEDDGHDRGEGSPEVTIAEGSTEVDRAPAAVVEENEIESAEGEEDAETETSASRSWRTSVRRGNSVVISRPAGWGQRYSHDGDVPAGGASSDGGATTPGKSGFLRLFLPASSHRFGFDSTADR